MYQEGPEHGDGREKVPDVMVIKEAQQDAVSVVLPGLGGGFLGRKGEHLSGPVPDIPCDTLAQVLGWVGGTHSDYN